MKKSFLPVLLLCGLQSAFAQTTTHEYAWENSSIADSPVNELFKNDNAVVLSEETTISFVDFLRPTIKKHQLIKYQLADGIKQHNTFALPESFDAPASRYLSSTNRTQSIYGPKLYAGAIRYFAGRIRKPDGTLVPASIKDSSEYERVNNKDFYASFFNVRNLNPGDILEVVYEYEIPSKYFIEKHHSNYSVYSGMYYISSNNAINTLNRVFFHGDMGKQQYSLRFMHNRNQLYEVKSFNNAHYTDSTDEGLITKYTWKAENLQGCINEYASRPYETLPYITLHFNAKNYKVDKGEEFVYARYSWASELLPLAGYKYSRSHMDKTLMTEERLTLADYISKHIPDTSIATALKIQQLHEAANEEYSYSCDQDFYNKTDTYKENLSGYIRGKKTIRDISRHYFYNLLLNDQTNQYYLTGISDKRIQSLDCRTFVPYTAVNWYYTVPVGNSVVYLSPKRHRFGLHLNELPFYLENTYALNLSRSMDIESRNTSYLKVPLTCNATPLNSFEDNYRRASVLVNIPTNGSPAVFESKLELQGQFSTMCRGLYKYGYKDSTANPKYGTNISTISADVKPVSQTISTEDINFPFKTDIRVKFESKTALQTRSDGTLVLNIGNWFNHIIQQDFAANGRVLPFYNDFTGKDTYRYNLVFDQPVEIKNAETLNKTIQTAYGDYTFSVKQLQPNVVLIESHYVVKKERVPENEVADVAQIYAAIQQVNNSTLELKLAK